MHSVLHTLLYIYIYIYSLLFAFTCVLRSFELAALTLIRASFSEPADAAVRPHLANNVSELFQRLLQTGILSEAQRKSENNDYKSISSMQRPPLPDIKLVPSDLRE